MEVMIDQTCDYQQDSQRKKKIEDSSSSGDPLSIDCPGDRDKQEDRRARQTPVLGEDILL